MRWFNAPDGLARSKLPSVVRGGSGGSGLGSQTMSSPFS
jgi:hypothetical protein